MKIQLLEEKIDRLERRIEWLEAKAGVKSSGPDNEARLIRIIEFTASAHGMTVDDMLSEVRTAELSQARFIGMWLARELTHCSCSEIGRAFRREGNASVLHGVQRVRDLMTIDPKMNQRCSEILGALRGSFEKALC